MAIDYQVVTNCKLVNSVDKSKNETILDVNCQILALPLNINRINTILTLTVDLVFIFEDENKRGQM